MASSVHFLFFLSFLVITSSYAQNSFRPKALVLPVTKDPTTRQYVTKINQRTPLVATSLVVHLGGRYLVVDCQNNYVSSSFRASKCRTAQCSLAESRVCQRRCPSTPWPGCYNDTCMVNLDNPVADIADVDHIGQDVVSVSSTNGLYPGPRVSVPNFIFACVETSFLQGLAPGANGMAGFGKNRITLPSQFASSFSFNRKFAVCLSSSTSSPGVIFLGDGPYRLLPNLDPSVSLTYTPIITNPVSTTYAFQGDPSYEYFIGVKSIKINNKNVALNATLLDIDNKGFGGTKLSTLNPYTVMEPSIFKAFSDAFINEAMSRNIRRVASVAPFSLCFSTENVVSTRLGPSVPDIELVLQSESVVWKITGSNSMVFVSDKVMCLGFVDRGADTREMTSIVIGGHQLEDNFLQFDLASSRLGFSSTLLGRQTTCANFNFTSRN